MQYSKNLQVCFLTLRYFIAAQQPQIYFRSLHCIIAQIKICFSIKLKQIFCLIPGDLLYINHVTVPSQLTFTIMTELMVRKQIKSKKAHKIYQQ